MVGNKKTSGKDAMSNKCYVRGCGVLIVFVLDVSLLWSNKCQR